MDLQAAIEKLVDDRVRRLLAEHVCPCQQESPSRPPARQGDEAWLATDEAAAYLRMSTRHLLRLARTGQVRGEQLARGGHWRFHRDWLDTAFVGRVRVDGELVTDLDAAAPVGTRVVVWAE